MEHEKTQAKIRDMEYCAVCGEVFRIDATGRERQEALWAKGMLAALFTCPACLFAEYLERRARILLLLGSTGRSAAEPRPPRCECPACKPDYGRPALPPSRDCARGGEA